MLAKRNLTYAIETFLLWGMAISITLLLIGQVFYFPYLLHDVALYVSLGQKVAQGGIPYVDVVDTNPPMIIYISTVPALISKFLHTPLAATALVFFLGTVLSLGFVFLLALKLVNPQLKQQPLLLIWTFWVLMALWVYKLGIFAEREHFIFLFLASFIVIRQGRYAGAQIGPGWAIFYGILAVIAIGMKPHYIIPWLGTEVLFMGIYQRANISRSIQSLKKFSISTLGIPSTLKSPEIISLSISGILYLGHFFLIPGMSSYYTYWIPLLNRGYRALDTSWSNLFSLQVIKPLLEFWPIIVLVIGIIIWRWQKKRLNFCPLAMAFAIFSILSFFVFIIQKKGWLYQSIDFHLGLIMVVALLSSDFLQQPTSEKENIIFTTALIICIITANYATANSVINKFFTDSRKFLQPELNPFALLIDHLTFPDESVMFLSTGVGDPFPAITYSGRINASRFGMAVPLAIILSNASSSGIAPEWQTDEKIYYSNLLEDIKENNPRIVLISNEKETAENITVLGYLKKKKTFFATGLADYTCVGKIDNFSVYLRLPPKENKEYAYYYDGVFYLYEQRLLYSFSKECSLIKE